jgi:MarR family transcriptional regulator, organic hydroperoxide resistance regulator
MADPFPTRFDSPDQSPGFLLWQVAHSWQRGQKVALEAVGLTHVQFVHLASLAWLTRTGAVVTQIELSRFTHTDVMVTSKVLRALEARDHVIRSEHPADSRANCLTLTRAGQNLVNEAVPLIEVADAAFFGALGSGLTAFQAALQSLAEIG